MLSAHGKNVCSPECQVTHRNCFWKHSLFLFFCKQWKSMCPAWKQNKQNICECRADRDKRKKLVERCWESAWKKKDSNFKDALRLFSVRRTREKRNIKTLQYLKGDGIPHDSSWLNIAEIMFSLMWWKPPLGLLGTSHTSRREEIHTR